LGGRRQSIGMLVLYEILLFRGEGQSWLGMASGWGIKTLGTGFFSFVMRARGLSRTHS